MYRHDAHSALDQVSGAAALRGQPGKRTLTQLLARSGAPATPAAAGAASAASGSQESLQARAAMRDVFSLHLLASEEAGAATPGAGGGGDAHAIAASGLAGAPSSLPHLEVIQRSFGHHDVRGVPAFVGGAATEASHRLGAHAYATGGSVAFASSPDLHTAAHEAAHVVQQRGGVQLRGGLGQVGDIYEQHADAVADRVVAGESAATLLDGFAGGGSGAGAAGVQRLGAEEGELAADEELESGGEDAEAPDGEPAGRGGGLAACERSARLASGQLMSALDKLDALAAMLPPGARQELAALSDEAMGHDDALWEALDAVAERAERAGSDGASNGASDDASGDASGEDAAAPAAGELDPAMLEEIERAITRVDLCVELVEAHHRLWSTFVTANVAALVRAVVGVALASIEALRARIAALESELRALEKKVKAAEQDLYEVAAQTGLDLVIDFGLPALLVALGVTNPFLGAALTVGGFIITWNADNLLGVDAEGAFGQLNNLNGVVEGVGAGSEAAMGFVEGTRPMRAVDQSIKAAAEGTGKACDVFGLALDAWEAKIGYDNLTQLRGEVAAAQHKVQILMEAWSAVAPHIGSLQQTAIGLHKALPRAVAQMGDELATIGAARAELAAAGG